MVTDRPLCFTPVFRSYIWGGTRLKDFLGKPVPSGSLWAESWEIVDHGEDQSQVADGIWQGRSLRSLIESQPRAMLGNDATSRTGFPLLLKYLDCQRVLSVQVHPDDAYAKEMLPPDLGKTEAWYVIDATEDALLYAGLKHGVGRSDLLSALETGEVEHCLHSFHPRPGDCVFIPAGTLHALGAGLIVAEIQQASDTTFRLFDWNRVDNDGKPRVLHIEQALEVTDFESGPVHAVNSQAIDVSGGRTLVDGDKFRLIELNKTVNFDANGHFKILTIVRGSGRLTWDDGERQLPLGQTVFLPAACRATQLHLTSNSIALLATGPVKANA